MQGTVISAKTPNTAIIEVVNRWQHPLYKKFVKKTKRYACHVEGLEIAAGDTVIIQECRPMSKTKKFKVTEKVAGKRVELKKTVPVAKAKSTAKSAKAAKASKVKKEKKEKK